MIRKLKVAYELYNLFHKSELQHNVSLYNKYGINKNYYSSISSEDFKHINSQQILEEGRKQKLVDINYFNSLNQKTKLSIESFDDLGYCIIPEFLNLETVDIINFEINNLLDSKNIRFKYGNKLMFAIHKSQFLKSLFDEHKIKPVLDYLIKGNATLFQSINFLMGSEQRTHSDSIHMTTFPLGGLLGVWIALEKITKENGPIHYYPKSHKLPYYLNEDYDNKGNKYILGSKGYSKYEEMIQSRIEDKDIVKQTFEAEPGDLFIWHANLLHGGNEHINKDKTRKSMVLHYFDSRRICYHEITQRPALMKKRL